MAPPAAPDPLGVAHCDTVAALYVVPPFVLYIHCHEYVDVPVLGIVAVNVEVCPWSTTAFDVIVGAAGAVRAEWTVTVEDAADVVLSGVVALSVTCSSKLYVLPPVSVLPAMLHVWMAPAMAPLPLFVPH